MISIYLCYYTLNSFICFYNYLFGLLTIFNLFFINTGWFNTSLALGLRYGLPSNILYTKDFISECIDDHSVVSKVGIPLNIAFLNDYKLFA